MHQDMFEVRNSDNAGHLAIAAFVSRPECRAAINQYGKVYPGERLMIDSGAVEASLGGTDTDPLNLVTDLAADPTEPCTFDLASCWPP